MKIYLVGGAVRDQLLNLPVSERDYVVVGADVNEMLALGYRQVGKDFPVFLHPVTHEEYALARIEKKTGPGYKGFAFEASKEVSLAEDLKRRDLTINAMAIDLDTNALIDPYKGCNDLQAKLLRHVAPAFSEDPVRILRVGRFLARYHCLGFKVADATITLIQQMVAKGEVNALVAERVWKELERALSEKNPEQFFLLLDRTKALAPLFPAIKVNGMGLNYLQTATTLTEKITVRFAVLLANLPEDKEDKTDALIFINELCTRYRVPNAYRELAQLTAKLHRSALFANTLAAENLLNLFMRLDIFRRQTRFHDFILACQAIALTEKNTSFDADWLLRAAQVAQSYDVHELLPLGLKTTDLAYAIKQKRIEKIEQWLLDQK